MKFKFLALSLPLALLFSCSSHDDLVNDVVNEDPLDATEISTGSDAVTNPIVFKVSMRPLTSPDGTRAPIIYKETFEGFYFTGYWGSSFSERRSNPYIVVKEKVDGTTPVGESGKWVSNQQWPSGIDTSTPIHFYAFADGKAVATDYDATQTNFQFFYKGGPSENNEAIANENSVAFNEAQENPHCIFTVDETSYAQNDILVAKQVACQNDGSVFFQFDHACAALQFAICKNASLHDYAIEVKNVKVCNLAKKGYYFFEKEAEPEGDVNFNWYCPPAKTVDSYNPDNVKYNVTNFTLTAFESNGAAKNSFTVGELTASGDDSSSDDATVDENGHIVAPDNPAGSTLLCKDKDDYMFVIPQTLEPWYTNTSVAAGNGGYIEIECKISNGVTYYVGGESEYGKVYIPFGDKFKMGYIHRYNIIMGITALFNANGGTISLN